MTITAVDSIQLSESNTRHWAFGYEGRFEFIGDSCLVADSQGKLSSSKRMILLLEFDKGLFLPAAKANEPWADKKKRALEGSDYETDDLTIGALLLKLMSRGDLTITREKYKDELQDMLKILKPIEKIDQETKGDDRLCQHVLRLLTMASGKDLVLQPTEFKSWCKNKDNVAKVKDFMNLLETKPDQKYIEKNAADLYGLKAFLKISPCSTSAR